MELPAIKRGQRTKPKLIQKQIRQILEQPRYNVQL